MSDHEFVGDWDISTRFPCVGFARDWNGWAVPIVARPALEALIEATGMDWSVSFDARGIATLTSHNSNSDPDSFPIRPDGFGLYRLDMGWTFYDVRDLEDDGPVVDVRDLDRDEWEAFTTQHDGTWTVTPLEMFHAMTTCRAYDYTITRLPDSDPCAPAGPYVWTIGRHLDNDYELTEDYCRTLEDAQAGICSDIAAEWLAESAAPVPAIDSVPATDMGAAIDAVVADVRESYPDMTESQALTHVLLTIDPDTLDDTELGQQYARVMFLFQCAILDNRDKS